MNKIIFKNFQSPGDIVMLTAAIRDLHKYYPSQFLTDVRTSSPYIWLNNPYLTNLSESDGDTLVIDCHYPLIHQSNTKPYHFVHGFIDYINQKLNLNVKPTQFKGDIHLSIEEKKDKTILEKYNIPNEFWLMVSGGKADFTIKWWSPKRYQEVINSLKGKITFVQVGEMHHLHPSLNETIDLRGKTNLRELIQLVYHSKGVLTPVSLLMHLSAAIEYKFDPEKLRPCVVIAGGREPAHWEEYPGHQFIHTIGALDCCKDGGCWKSRTFPLKDGEIHDRPENLCVNTIGDLPACMDMIEPLEVINRIKIFLRYEKGINHAIPQNTNPIDYLPNYDRRTKITNLNVKSQLNWVFDNLISYPNTFFEKGIVICAGGEKYLLNAWVCVRMLRKLGCTLPIQIWQKDGKENVPPIHDQICQYDVTFVNAENLFKFSPFKNLNGWELKSYAILNSPFRDVLLLDADNVPVQNPEFLFDSEDFKNKGAIFWPDISLLNPNNKLWELLDLQKRNEIEFETGQILIDKSKVWKGLCLSMWINENSDYFYNFFHGDKEAFHFGFMLANDSYHIIECPTIARYKVMNQYDFEKKLLFQHRNRAKWDFSLNEQIPGFIFEDDCMNFIQELSDKLKMPKIEKRNFVSNSPFIKNFGFFKKKNGLN